MAQYTRPEDGEWVKPVMSGYKVACCDCGLVHRIDFRLIHHGRRDKVLFRAYRLARSTALFRRWMKGKSAVKAKQAKRQVKLRRRAVLACREPDSKEYCKTLPLKRR